MSTRLQHVVVDASDPSRLARFWADALGWRIIIEDEHEVEIAGAEHDVNVIFVPVPEPKRSKNRVHFDLGTKSQEEQAETVERLIALGARHADIGQGDVPHAVLADPEGNEFCVVGESILSDVRPISAIAYDAMDAAALGRFWREAAGWPIVFERQDLCALRSPAGRGPFITFGGPPERVAAKPVKNRIHLDVAPFEDADHAADVERLISLGARCVDIGQGDTPWTVLADPEDNEFCVLTPR